MCYQPFSSIKKLYSKNISNLKCMAHRNIINISKLIKKMRIHWFLRYK